MRKKTEILRFRTDAETLAELTKLCSEAGWTPSQFLREILVSALANKRDCMSAVPGHSRDLGQLAASRYGRHRDQGAPNQVPRSILVDEASQADASPVNWQRKYLEMLHRLHAVLRAVDSLRSADPLPAHAGSTDLRSAIDMQV